MDAGVRSEQRNQLFARRYTVNLSAYVYDHAGLDLSLEIDQDALRILIAKGGELSVRHAHEVIQIDRRRRHRPSTLKLHLDLWRELNAALDDTRVCPEDDELAGCVREAREQAVICAKIDNHLLPEHRTRCGDVTAHVRRGE
jgi:hypothetical protein